MTIIVKCVVVVVVVAVVEVAVVVVVVVGCSSNKNRDSGCSCSGCSGICCCIASSKMLFTTSLPLSLPPVHIADMGIAVHVAIANAAVRPLRSYPIGTTPTAGLSSSSALRVPVRVVPTLVLDVMDAPSDTASQPHQSAGYAGAVHTSSTAVRCFVYSRISAFGSSMFN